MPLPSEKLLCKLTQAAAKQTMLSSNHRPCRAQLLLPWEALANSRISTLSPLELSKASHAYKEDLSHT